MRRILTIILTLFAACSAFGQESTKSAEQIAEAPKGLIFNSEEWDFGRINEVDGPVSHTFCFTNPYDHPITIERVYTSCGCTNTDYSRRAIKPNEKGNFTIEFDPEGREGRFDKKVTIVYNQGQDRTILRVKGKVIGRPRSVADLYPQDLGCGVRADSNYKAFGNIAQDKTRSMTIALINTLDHTTSLDYVWLESSGLLEVNMPTELEAGEVALATFTYAVEGERYGLMRDRLGVLIGGEQSGKEIVTTAIGIDNFERSAHSDGTRPKANIEPVYHDFGDARRGTLLEVDITITNGGSAPLVVRSVVPREGTTLDLPEGTIISAGKTLTAHLTFKVPAEGYDTVYGGAMIVVNDPLRPVRELRVAANVKGISQ